MINEEVLARLVEKAIMMEEMNVNTLMRLFMAEDDENGRRVLYVLLRDCERHKVDLIECLKTLKGGVVPEPSTPERYNFEEMFYAEKAAILRKVKVVLRDYYKYLLEDARRAEREGTIDRDVLTKAIPCLEFLSKEKERQLKMIEEVWKAY